MADFRMRGFPGIPMVIKNLIIINVLVWLAQLTFGLMFTNALSLHYYKSPYFGVWQLVTYMFLHAPNMPFHILFNMFSLWMFGSSLENLWGPKRFLTFYLICGIGAGVIQMLANVVELNIWFSRLNDQKVSEFVFQEHAEDIVNSIALGASGAVMGVLAAFALLFPNQQLFIIPIPFPIKAKYLVIGLILLDLFGGINPRYGGGIAHFAHLGGALFGFILVKTMNQSNRRDFY